MSGRSGWRVAALAVAAGGWLGVLVLPAWAQDLEFSAEGGEEITVDAESISYDRRAQILSASGDVVIRRDDMVLRADSVRLNRQTEEVDAVGNVSLSNPSVIIHAREIHLDLDDEVGFLLGAEVHSPRFGYSLWGERVEKGVGQTYHIENGRFTTCECDEGPPSWSISGQSLDVAIEGYGTIEGGKFEILDVPVLYLPRATIPVNLERHSGFLFPRIGLSNRRGFQLLQPYYWAISKSQDATISADIETAARLGLIGEYRYAFSRKFAGEFQAMYFNEKIRGRPSEVTVPEGADPDVPENRWAAIGNHSQRVGPFEGYVDLFLVGDDLFLREINTFTIDNQEDVALRTRTFTASRAGLMKQWSRAVAQGEAVVYQNLVGRETLVLQSLPELGFGGQKQLGHSLALGVLQSSLTNFQRSNGIAGVRVDLFPGVQLRLPLGRSFFGNVRAGFRETAYFLTENEMSGGFSGTDPDAEPIHLPDTSSRELVEVRGDFGTGFSRVFDFPYFGADKLKHTIEPRLEYLYIPAVGQDDLPVFDGIDRIGHRNLLTYGLVSRLLARTAADGDGKQGEVYELTRLSIEQSFDVTGSVPRPGDPQETGHLSDIDFAVRVNPGATTSVRFRSTFNTTTADLTSVTVGVLLREPMAVVEKELLPRIATRSSLSAEYRFIADNDLPGASVIQQFDTSLLLRITKQIGFRYSTRYNIQDNRFLGNFFGLRYVSSCDCWSLDLGVSDKSNPNELSLQAQVTLVGLGSAGGGTGVDLGD